MASRSVSFQEGFVTRRRPVPPARWNSFTAPPPPSPPRPCGSRWKWLSNDGKSAGTRTLRAAPGLSDSASRWGRAVAAGGAGQHPCGESGDRELRGGDGEDGAEDAVGR